MKTNDPFDIFEDDKTVFRPVDTDNPTERTDEISGSESPLPHSRAGTHTNKLLGNLNPLEHVASPLLLLLARLSTTTEQHDANRLKATLVKELIEFKDNCVSEGISESDASVAQYILCTALDEAILNTAWGQESGWSSQSLLSRFHHDVSGGDTFYQILKKLGDKVQENRDILVLMYLCLSMGFKGRYRVVEDGAEKVDKVRQWLYSRLFPSETPQKALSPHCEGESKPQQGDETGAPYWTKVSGVLLLLGILMISFLYQLSSKSDQVLSTLADLSLPPTDFHVVAPSPPDTPVDDQNTLLTLRNLLSEEIKRDELAVEENRRSAKVTLAGDGMFKPGKANVDPDTEYLLTSIGEALNLIEGRIQVTGHSDSIPIRTTAYPSNWELSKARADAVARVLGSRLADPTRIIAEGRANLQPIADDATPEGRAKNRRVEVMLIKQSR